MTPFILPMLAHALDNEQFLDAEGWIAEPKLDGQRIQVHIHHHRTVGLYSRTGRVITSSPGLAWVRELAWKRPEGILDGELCVGTGLNGTAPEVASAKSAGADASFLVLFDCLSVAGLRITHHPWGERREQLTLFLAGQQNPRIKLTVTHAQPRALWTAWTKMGGEGIVLKRAESLYQAGKRSWDWLKKKVESTADVVVIGLTDKPTYTSGGYRGGEVALVYGFYDPATGQVVRAGQGLHVGSRKDLAPLIGRIAEVRHAGELASGGLKSAQFVRWRDDKRKEDCTR